MENENKIAVSVIWRDKHIKVEMNADSSVREFGQKLQNLTKVKPETMRLLVPQSTSKGSKLITPFSDEYSSLSLREVSIPEGKPVRMMGVFAYEIEEVSQNNMKPDLRIRGFDEEEERLRQRLLNTRDFPLKLPQGPNIFCGFRTLQLPGIELNPPASEALRIMHMLACDPGIISIMNKHRWRVGIMTEMAPVGYVGISPKCVLGFNKNRGEEISLRLRTDDLKGFRKYESIKRTLLHELAHMVHSEHDANFYALDKQLNQESASLDWTKSASQTLSGMKVTDHYKDVHLTGSNSQRSFQKLGGRNLSVSINAHASSVAAAFGRLLNATSNGLEGSQPQMENVNAERTTEYVHQISNKRQFSNATVEPDPDDNETEELHDNALVISVDDMQVDSMKSNNKPQSISPVPEGFFEFDPDGLNERHMLEPDPDDSLVEGNMKSYGGPEPDDSWFGEGESHEEPVPDDPGSYKTDLRHGEVPGSMANTSPGNQMKLHYEMSHMEPDPDDSESKDILLEPMNKMDRNPDDLQESENVQVEPDPDDSTESLNNEEFRRIEEPVSIMVKRLQKAIEMLWSEATPVEATSALQTLIKIIRNVIDHPDEIKFRRLRKGNPLFQRNVANFKAAMEVLTVIGFCEDVVADEFGRMETYLVLRRNDPGLLWLAKSSLEVSSA
uniref:Ubiquitin and WLM domain-containing protein C1442.07c n=1 Tax=Anthurium amnicola TaxID=1678845 RepID=A0A1D1Y0A4_9ARAE